MNGKWMKGSKRQRERAKVVHVTVFENQLNQFSIEEISLSKERVCAHAETEQSETGFWFRLQVQYCADFGLALHFNK